MFGKKAVLWICGCLLVLVPVVAFSANVHAQQEPVPVAFSDLKLSHASIAVGERVQASFRITNLSESREAKGTATLQINDGVELQVNYGPIRPGRSSTIIHRLTFNSPGIFEVTVGDLEPKTVEVIEKAKFVFRDLELSRAEVNIDEVVTLSILIRNVSTLAGTAVAQLFIDGNIKDSVTVDMNVGQEVMVVFRFKFAAPDFGFHQVAINDLPPLELLVLGRDVVSVQQAIDENGDLRIGDSEILKAVALWVNGVVVPGTGGSRIGDDQMSELMHYWVVGDSILRFIKMPPFPTGFSLRNRLLG